MAETKTSLSGDGLRLAVRSFRVVRQLVADTGWDLGAIPDNPLSEADAVVLAALPCHHSRAGFNMESYTFLLSGQNTSRDKSRNGCIPTKNDALGTEHDAYRMAELDYHLYADGQRFERDLRTLPDADPDECDGLLSRGERENMRRQFLRAGERLLSTPTECTDSPHVRPIPNGRVLTECLSRMTAGCVLRIWLLSYAVALRQAARRLLGRARRNTIEDLLDGRLSGSDAVEHALDAIDEVLSLVESGAPPHGFRKREGGARTSITQNIVQDVRLYVTRTNLSTPASTPTQTKEKEDGTEDGGVPWRTGTWFETLPCGLSSDALRQRVSKKRTEGKAKHEIIRSRPAAGGAKEYHVGDVMRIMTVSETGRQAIQRALREERELGST